MSSQRNAELVSGVLVVARPRIETDGRALLRSLVSDLTGVDASEIVIAASCPDCGRAHGRPTVALRSAGRVDARRDGDRTPTFVSLAYAGDKVVAAAALHRPVGVDAERNDTSTASVDAIRTITGFHASASRPAAEVVRHWTRVEAVLKADGRGLRVDPRLVQIHSQANDSRTARGVVATIGDEPSRYELLTAALSDDLIVSVALGSPTRCG